MSDTDPAAEIAALLRAALTQEALAAFRDALTQLQSGAPFELDRSTLDGKDLLQ